MIPTTIVIVLLVCAIRCVYDVPSYYGHFSRNFFRLSKIKEGTFTYFEFHFAVDMDTQNRTVYFANSKHNCIETFDLLTQKKGVLAGNCGHEGNRVGETRHMLLNHP